MEVAKLLARGLQNSEIADQLFLSIRTVEGHRLNIFRKLQCKNIVDLVHYAHKQGWNR